MSVVWVNSDGENAPPSVSARLEELRPERRGLRRYRAQIGATLYFRILLADPEPEPDTRAGLVRLVIGWDCSLSSQNTRNHWRTEYAVKRAARFIARETWRRQGAIQLGVPVRVSVVCRRGRALDLLNIPGACKSSLDGVFVGGLTPDDSPAWVQFGTVRQETGARWKADPQLEFVVEPLNEASASFPARAPATSTGRKRGKG